MCCGSSYFASFFFFCIFFFFFLLCIEKDEINVRCVLSKWDYFVKKENLILGLKIKTRTNKEEQKLI